jgi:DNA-binding transcriptional LysR family regulator
LPQVSHRLQREAPRLGLEIFPFGRDVFRRLLAGELDLVLYSDDPVPDSLRTQKLFDESYAGLAHARHPALAWLADGRMPMDTFVANPHALVTVFGDRAGVVDDALDAIGRKREIRLWLPYFAAAALVASQRDLLLTTPRRVAVNLARSLQLVQFELPFEIEPFGYQMVWHERSHADPGSRWFRSLVADVSATV